MFKFTPFCNIVLVIVIWPNVGGAVAIDRTPALKIIGRVEGVGICLKENMANT